MTAFIYKSSSCWISLSISLSSLSSLLWKKSSLSTGFCESLLVSLMRSAISEKPDGELRELVVAVVRALL